MTTMQPNLMTDEQLVEVRNQLPKQQGGGFYYHDMSIPAAMAIEYHKQDADIRALDVEIEKRGLRYEWRNIRKQKPKGSKPMVEHYETLEVNGKKYDVFVNYACLSGVEGEPGKFFEVFDSDGCCINPDAIFLKPPIEQDIAAAIRRLNGSDEAYDYQRTEDAMDALSESMNPTGGE